MAHPEPTPRTAMDERAAVEVLKGSAKRHRANPAALADRIDCVLTSGKDFGQVRGDSSHHPNGFAKIVLGPGEIKGTRLRLHVWPAQTADRVPDEAPHDHRWPFASWVVSGDLVERRYRRSPLGRLFAAYRHRRDARDEPIEIPAGSARLARTRRTVRKRGQVYSRSPGDVHTATPRGGDTVVVSLVVQGQQTRDDAAVFRRQGIPLPSERPIPEDELRSILRDVVRLLRSLP